MNKEIKRKNKGMLSIITNKEIKIGKFREFSS